MTRRFRPQYPSAAEVDDLLRKLRTGSATEADLTRAVKMLTKAGIRCSKVEQRALKAALQANR